MPCPLFSPNLEIGIQSIASLDTAADPTSLPHFAAPGPFLRAKSTHSLCFCLPLSLLSLPSQPSFPLAFFPFAPSSKAKQSASSAALATSNNELAGLCCGPLCLTTRPRHHSHLGPRLFLSAPVSTAPPGRGQATTHLQAAPVAGPENPCDRICSISCIRPSCCVNS